MSSLPVPVSPVNQHGAVHRRHELQRREDLPHRRALTDDAVEAVAILELRAELGVLGAKALLIETR